MGYYPSATIRATENMQIGHIHVQNYRGLKNVEVSISKFACVIGENNSGKSSLLQAFTIFLSGTKLDKHNYYDETQPIVVTVRFDNVTDTDLDLLAEQHRPRINEIIYDGTLTLVRRFPLGEPSQLRCKRMIPTEPRFRENTYSEGLKGKNGKDIESFLTGEYPELEESETHGASTQRAAKALIEGLISNLSPDDFVLEEADLPTGIASSVSSLFPEPIYVPAVKDFADEIKTKQSATFGKLLSVLLEAIEPKLKEAREIFKNLEKHLNRISHPDGSQTDDRLDDVKRIEDMVARYLRDIFAQIEIELRIPPPDVKTILNNAEIEINDGVKGSADTKGDGLKRAITFAIFRSYVELSKSSKNSPLERQNRFLFLFEEPELYLHPIAQRTLFEALSQVSQHHQVLISTHSPFFFQPQNTDMFIKVKKVTAEPKPCGEIVPVNLSNMSSRDLFQIISFETSNTAFFGKKVVLVEGDSELITIPHLARVLNEDWDFVRNHISIVKIDGKGSIRRFKEFFAAFDIPVVAIADLDILVNNFDQLGVEENIRRLQSTLLQKADAAIEALNSSNELVGLKQAKKKLKGGDQEALWKKVQEDYSSYQEEHIEITTLVGTFESFINALKSGVQRMDILCDHSYIEILQLKRELLAKLREQGIYIWEKGCLDNYYPDEITPKHRKPERAFNFCQKVIKREAVLALCEEIPIDETSSSAEFEVVFSSIFNGIASRKNGSV